MLAIAGYDENLRNVGATVFIKEFGENEEFEL